ncbi:uncharacterized protein C1orf87-like [Clavelina lepadiformis]
MNRTTKNAPFGTDNTPVLELKIVGGKRVEVLSKKAELASSELWKNVKSPARGPHGTPSMLTQPNFRAYEYSDLQRGYSTAMQHETARDVTSYTSPFGDRTRSYRHGVPAINKHPVLPPIGVSQPPGNNFISESFHHEELSDSMAPSSDESLADLVSRRLRGFNNNKMKDMYVELSGFDRHMTGFVNESQLSLVFLRHDLPLKLSTIKILMHKFSDSNNLHEINYEKLLQFLSSCAANRGSRLDRSRVERSPEPPKMNEADPSSHRHHSPPASEVDEKMVSLLEEQLADVDEVDLDAMKKQMMKADRLENGEIHADKIVEIFLNQRIPLTSSVLTKMLQRSEIAQGMVNWRLFLLPLAHACHRLNLGSHHLSHVTSPEKSALSTSSSINSVLSRQEPLPSSASVRETSATQAPTPEPHRERNKNGVFPQSRMWDGEEKPSIEEEDSSPRRTDLWMRNFTRLAHALRNYHPFKSDALPRTEVERMAANYNLIYSLGFSNKKLDDAIKRAVTSEGKPLDKQTVAVEKLLSALLGSYQNL